jgi:hypothetical protein
MQRLTSPSWFGLACFAFAASSWPLAASAQDENFELEESGSGDEFAAEGEGEQAGEPESKAEEVPAVDDSAWSPVEKPGETYYFVGARYRAIVVPQGMINLFADGGQTFVVHGVGAEFGIRRDNFEILPAVWFANYSFDPTPFKGKDDGADAWELVQGNLKVLYLTADFLWSTPINEQFAFNYGAGAGLGLVLGDITRHEAYFPGGLPGNPDGAGLVKCQGPNTPANGQCPADGQYNAKDDAWPLFPWLAVQTGLRYKPHKSFVARLDLGFSTSGLFFGLGANYGI